MRRTQLKRKTRLSSKSTLNAVSKKKREASKEPIYSTFSATPKPMNKNINRPQVKKGGSGLTGHGRSKSDQELHSAVSATGCAACRALGIDTKHRIVVHHIFGRNKSADGDCYEQVVIGLCEQHHNPLSVLSKDNLKIDISAPSVHDNKRLFTELVGSEMWCCYETYRLINRQPVWTTEGEWQAYLLQGSQSEQEAWLVENPPKLKRVECRSDVLKGELIDDIEWPGRKPLYISLKEINVLDHLSSNRLQVPMCAADSLPLPLAC